MRTATSEQHAFGNGHILHHAVLLALATPVIKLSLIYRPKLEYLSWAWARLTSSSTFEAFPSSFLLNSMTVEGSSRAGVMELKWPEDLGLS